MDVYRIKRVNLDGTRVWLENEYGRLSHAHMALDLLAETANPQTVARFELVDLNTLKFVRCAYVESHALPRFVRAEAVAIAA